MTQFCYLAYDGRHYKIGKSLNPESRIKNLKTGNPNLKLLYYTDKVSEGHIHKLMAHRRIGGEFFELTDHERKILLQYMKGVINTINHKSIRKIRSKSDRARRYDQSKMTFGKYKGTRISEIEDVGYLKWVVNNVSGKDEIKKVIENRIKTLKHRK